MKRPVYQVLGLASVALGAIGAFLPIMPTVPFLLLAAFFFARSNRKWEQRILDHPTWGPYVHDWRERRAISRRSKLTAIGAMATGVAFTWYSLGFPWVWVSLVVLAISGTWIWTRNE